MFVRWRRRPLRREQDLALDALLVQSVWTAGTPRQRVVRYLATIQARYRTAPAHRYAFWQGAERRLETLDLPPETRQALEAQLAQQVPRPTPEELAQVAAWRRAFAYLGEPPALGEAPSGHENARLHSDGH